MVKEPKALRNRHEQAFAWLEVSEAGLVEACFSCHTSVTVRSKISTHTTRLALRQWWKLP